MLVSGRVTHGWFQHGACCIQDAHQLNIVCKALDVEKLAMYFGMFSASCFNNQILSTCTVVAPSSVGVFFGICELSRTTGSMLPAF